MAFGCIIIDDEPLAVKLLSDYVERAPELNLLASFTDPIRALQEFQGLQPDLLFLDVQMPEINGLQVAKIIGNQCRVILTTAYDEYALQGYELNVVDYLLKPISYERFGLAINKLYPEEGSTDRMPDNSPKDFLFVKSGHRTHRVALEEILYGSSSGDYLTLHLAEGRKLLTLEKITQFVDRLPTNRFCRIHRSHFVALQQIDYVERRRVVVNGVYLPISDGYAADFSRLLNE
jgi:two-component system LytT family response regulator